MTENKTTKEHGFEKLPMDAIKPLKKESRKDYDKTLLNKIWDRFIGETKDPDKCDDYYSAMRKYILVGIKSAKIIEREKILSEIEKRFDFYNDPQYKGKKSRSWFSITKIDWENLKRKEFDK